MKEVNIIFTRIVPNLFTATIEEVPEIEISAPTFEEIRMHMFDIVHLLFVENRHEENLKLNIVLKMKISHTNS